MTTTRTLEAPTGYQLLQGEPPAEVVRAQTADDIADAVRRAVAAGLPVGVQATGHGRARTTEAGLLIDTSAMTAVHVDPATRIARVEAGATWAAVIAAGAPHGLAPISGSAPHVGAVGYTLGGGFGIMSRRFGYAADRVRRLEVVTADGVQRVATPDVEPDLYWALLGGRDNVGIVTAIQTELVPLTTIYGGGLFFAAEHVPAVLAAWRRWTETVPDAMTSSVGLIPYPDVPQLPEPLRGRYVAHVRIAFDGSAADGERLVAPLRAVGPRLVDDLRELPFAESASIYRDPPCPDAYTGDNVLLDDLTPAGIDGVLAVTGPNAPMFTVVEFRHLGGAMTAPAPNAVGHRDAAYLARIVTPTPAEGIDAAAAVHQRMFDALRDTTIGRSLTFAYFADSGASDIEPDRIASAFEPADYRRLGELKRRFDPANLFRLGQVIGVDQSEDRLAEAQERVARLERRR